MQQKKKIFDKFWIVLYIVDKLYTYYWMHLNLAHREKNAQDNLLSTYSNLKT